jgi:hypothetical protein
VRSLNGALDAMKDLPHVHFFDDAIRFDRARQPVSERPGQHAASLRDLQTSQRELRVPASWPVSASMRMLRQLESKGLDLFQIA